jgi:diaminopimelate epimerase
MKFYKLQGAGNDYIYIDGITSFIDVDSLLPKVPRLSDRHFGIGSDGVIFLLPSDKADVRMRMFNGFDSSEAQMCGNGVRCVMALAHRLKLVPKKATIETSAGIVLAQVLEKKEIGIRMFYPPKVSNTAEKVTVCGRSFQFYRADMGNPHAVILLPENEDLDTFPVEKYGPTLEGNLALFPEKTNVEFFQETSFGSLKMRVWERNSGETMACGTGACATAGVYRALNPAKTDSVTVRMKGGALKLSWKSDGFYMQGPAVFVFEGEFNPSDF